ncbi:MAG: hypothetical protein GX237_09500 [Clostridiales bacterium]|nr:hypothetical protein [Clostridiales bacterium]
MKKLVTILIFQTILILSLTACKTKDKDSLSDSTLVPDVSDITLDLIEDSLSEDEEPINNNIPEPTPSAEVQVVDMAKDQVEDTAYLEDITLLVSDDFLMEIDDVFSITGRGVVVVGKISSGSISVGAEIYLFDPQTNNKRTVRIGGIEIFRELIESAYAGDIVGILLSDLERTDLKAGDFLASKESIHDYFVGEITFFEEKDQDFYKNTFDASCIFTTSDTTCRISFIEDTLNEDGTIVAEVNMVTGLPLMIDSEFSIYYDGIIASGKINSFEKYIDENSGTDDERTGITVILVDCGDRKVNVIKELRDILECGLKEAKDLVDQAPSVISENLSIEEAENIRTRLEELGAKTKIVDEDQDEE